MALLLGQGVLPIVTPLCQTRREWTPACGAVCHRAICRSGTPCQDAAGVRPPGSTVVVTYVIIVIATLSLSLTSFSQDGLHQQEQCVVILNLSLALTAPAALEGCVVVVLPPCPCSPPTIAIPAEHPPCPPLQLACHHCQHQHTPECPGGTNPPHRAAAPPTKPLDNLIHHPRSWCREGPRPMRSTMATTMTT
jgi:hypothetical protein